MIPFMELQRYMGDGKPEVTMCINLTAVNCYWTDATDAAYTILSIRDVGEVRVHHSYNDIKFSIASGGPRGIKI